MAVLKRQLALLVLLGIFSISTSYAVMNDLGAGGHLNDAHDQAICKKIRRTVSAQNLCKLPVLSVLPIGG